MDRSTPGNVIEASARPTVASILGVTGSFRFCPHGSTQKAHVVLRRVDAPEDADEEADPSMVYFSLFAQKRIEVKPGKEILLAVAAPDGRIIDTPVILAAQVAGSAPPEEHQVFSEDRLNVVASAKELTMPPRMRKSWSKRFDIVQPLASYSRSYTSVSVQTEWERSPSPSKDLDTAEPSQDLAGQVAPPATAEHSEASSSTQAEEHSASSRRDKSLSPMELDSPGSSVPSSPHIPTPQTRLPEEPKSASFSPPGLWISTSPPKELNVDSDSQITPFHLSPDNGDPPGLSSLPPPSQSRTSPQKHTSEPSVVTESDKSEVSASDANVASSGAEASAAMRSVQEFSKVSPPTSESPAVVPYVPKRKVVPNPFVSGGLLTDFVGTTSSRSSPMSESQASTGNGEHAESVARPMSIASSSSLSPPPGLNAATVVGLSVGEPKNAAPATVAASAPPNVPRTPVRTKSPVALSPSSASSSKVKVEDVPLNASDTSLPPPPRPLFSSPQSTLPGRAIRTRWSDSLTKDSSPPPDIKSLSYVPTISYSNPLGIRPSPGYSWRGRPPFPPSGPQNPSRKPVTIGSGWPHNRHTNGHGRRQNYRRTSNGSETGQLLSQADAFRQSQASPNFSTPIQDNMEENIHDNFSDPLRPMGQSTRSRSSSGTWNHPADGSYSPLSVEPAHPASEIRSPSTPLSASPARSPTVTARGRSIPAGHDIPVASHPLPPKPPAFAGPPPDGAYSPRLGVKRMGSPIPQAQTPEPRRPRTFRWSVSEPFHSARVKGDGDVGVRTIAHSSDGAMLAITCLDKSVRIWNNKSRTETAKLAHNMQVTAVAWMERDAGVVTLGENGIVSTWTRSAGNKWQWAKILDASDRKADVDSPSSLAFLRDRIAIGYPKSGVKVWLFIKGTWLPQRSIIRQNVTAIKFIEDGEALVGGTTDGVLWYCQVPNGTLRAYAFLKFKIYSLDVDSKETHALAAQVGGRAHLINIRQEDQKGNVEQVYASNDSDLQDNVSYDFGALFAGGGSSLLFGCTRGCVLVWSRHSGEIVHGLQHEEDAPVQAVSCFDRGHVTESHILTGTRQGMLTWFSHPKGELNGHLR